MEKTLAPPGDLAGVRRAKELEKAAQAMFKASAPFRAIWKINEPLRLPDDRPLATVIPGAWPDMGELRALYEASERLRAALAKGAGQ
ncbi:hypothetical protein [Phenylobacterium sp.]|uniref:hypothetical protein n=1 Tax=Phenylobacterium sp. TaxID=1871053 RepID=UPI00271E347D|nr:hypothetical protein [Phenylobacterium sp.]MDO8800099.1 hypothetical protein [Phenylobacterium sp.]